MTDFEKWYKITKASAETAGTQPKIRDFMAVQVVDNFQDLLLLGFTVALWLVGVYGSLGPDGKTFTLHAAELCLGVFLGRFKKRS